MMETALPLTKPDGILQQRADGREIERDYLLKAFLGRAVFRK